MARFPGNRRLLAFQANLGGHGSLKPGEQERLSKVNRLITEVQEASKTVRTDLNRLRLHARRLVEDADEEARAEQGNLAVPRKVYRFLYFLEARAIQRQRNTQQSHGVFHQATFRQWKRKLYSNVRARINNFRKDFKHRLEIAEARVSNEDINLGLRDDEEGRMGNLQFLKAEGEPFGITGVDRELRLRRQCDLQPSASRVLKEPSRETGRHARRSNEYKRLKNARKRANKSARKQGTSEVDDTASASSSMIPSALVRQREESPEPVDDAASVSSSVIPSASCSQREESPELSPPASPSPLGLATDSKETLHVFVFKLIGQTQTLLAETKKPYSFASAPQAGEEPDLLLKCEWCGQDNLPMDMLCVACRKLLPIEGIDLEGLKAKFGFREATVLQVDESEDEQMGQTEVDFSLPTPEPPAGSTAPHSKLDLSKLIHWRDGVLNSRANKHHFAEATKGIPLDTWMKLEDTQVTEQTATAVWLFHNIEHLTPPVKVTDLLPTKGGWFYTDVTFSAGDPDFPTFDDPQVAYHGCSIDSAAKILRGTGLRTGVCVTSGKEGIYCERKNRVQCCMGYATHSLAGNVVAACIMELCVDRSKGTSIHSQWVQPEGSVLITGIYTHVVPLTSLFKPGYFGWYRLHNSIFTLLPNMKF
jgi:hypothetical protein